MRTIILFVFATLTLQQVDYAFNGIRVTQLATDYLSDFFVFAEDGFKKTGGTKFDDIISNSGEGADKQILTIFNITYNNFKYNKDEIIGTPVINAKKNFWTLEVDSGVFEYIYSFKWKVQVFGVNLLFGNATISLKSSKLKITQAFANGATTTGINVNWNLAIVDFYCSEPKKADTAKPWISKTIVTNFSAVLEKIIQAEVPKEVDDDMITNYNKVHLNLEDGMQMELLNTLDSMYKYSSGQGDYISLQYNTTIILPGRPFITQIWRKIFPKLAPQHDLEICYNEEIFADIMDTLGKGRYYYHVFTDQEMAYTMNAGNFYPVMPDLINRYVETEPVKIGCRPDISYRVVDLKIKDKPFYMQIPMRCTFVIARTGEEFMSASVDYRAKYTPMAYIDGGVSAELSDVHVHNVRASFWHTLGTQMELSEILDKTVSQFSSLNVIYPSRVSMAVHRPQRYQYKGLISDASSDAICVSFDKYSSMTE